MPTRGPRDDERARRNVVRAMRMQERPLNAAKLAQRADVDQKTVRAFLSGQRWPHSDTLVKLDRALNQPEGTIEAWATDDQQFLRDHAPEPVAPAPVTLDDASDLELARALLARLESRR